MSTEAAHAFQKLIAEKYVGELRRFIRLGNTLEQAIELARSSPNLREFLDHANEDTLENAQVSILQELNVAENQWENVKIPALVGTSQQKWYAGPIEGDRYWPIYAIRLNNNPRLSEQDVDRINRETSETVSLLPPPTEEQFTCRGLVVGYVQSGKTAHMAGVIAKCADRGYGLIIVLAGMHNALRSQTQSRLETDLSLEEKDIWSRLTTADDDFALPGHLPLPLSPNVGRDGTPVCIAVIKKHGDVLKNLLGNIDKTNKASLRCRVLLLDDECDQASPNVGKTDEDPSTINDLIRQLINKFPRISYVGYTATPFANVLINPEISIDPNHPDDLYPKDFIFAMERNPGYFGSRELFGLSGSEEDDTGIDVIRTVPDEDFNALRPGQGRRMSLPKSLDDAMRYFLLASAARRIRGHEQHSTMLVHTDHRINKHEDLERLVKPRFDGLLAEIENEDQTIINELRDMWNRECDLVPAQDYHNAPVTFEDLLPALKTLKMDFSVHVENSRNLALDYSQKPNQVIAVIGGNILSRGLTLEGLTVSYFLRTSKQYDTLLQMARWFGYRRGYEDFQRIWCTARTQALFLELAYVEDELRDDIAEYATRPCTPLDFAVRIRKIPQLAITQRNKMRHASTKQVSYSGSLIQTLHFNRLSKTIVGGNWRAASDLINRLVESRMLSIGSRLSDSTAPWDFVYSFLNNYTVDPAQTDFDKLRIIDYVMRKIDSADMRFSEWSICIASPDTGAPSRNDLGRYGRVGTAVRSRLLPDSQHETDEHAYIKGLTSTDDLYIGLPNEVEKQRCSWLKIARARQLYGLVNPVLFLYPIEARSQPRKWPPVNPQDMNRLHRAPMNAVGDLIGIAIGFPEVDHDGDYVTVNLPPPLNDPEAETVDDANTQ